MRKIVSLLVCLWLSLPAFGQEITDLGNANPEYVDRVIDSDLLSALDDEQLEADIDSSGSPRGWLFELGAGVSSANGETQAQATISASAYVETPDYGAWFFDVNLNKFDTNSSVNSGKDVINRWTIFQRGLVMNNGWRMDNSAGTLSLPVPFLLRQQYRFVLPTPLFLGLSTELSQVNGRILNAAIGRPSLNTQGYSSNTFADSGLLFAVGGQTKAGPFQAAATVVSLPAADGTTQASALAAVAWSDENNAVQTNVLADQKNAAGIWIDALSNANRIEHRYGIFRFDPLLEWGGQNMQSDIQGVYYHASSQQSRWNWSGEINYTQALSEPSPSSTYITGQGRYQLTSRWGLGGTASARVLNGFTATSFQAIWDMRTANGSASFLFDQVRTQELRSEQISWDQSFTNSNSFQLTTKLGLLQQHLRDERVGQEWTASVYGSQYLGARLSWNGLFRYLYGTGPLAASGLEANLGLNWAISQSWSLSATYFQNQGHRTSAFDLDPLQIQYNDLQVDDKSFFFALRYDYHAGQALGVLAGSAGSGAGEIVGEIYLDANADGRRNADEKPAADIVILLDGRYSTRTDANGRFKFNRVAAGTHTLLAINDNLPLPWQLPSVAQTIEVDVRDTTQWNVGALRPTK